MIKPLPFCFLFFFFFISFGYAFDTYIAYEYNPIPTSIWGCYQIKNGTAPTCRISDYNYSAATGYATTGYYYQDDDIDSCSGVALPCLTWNGNFSGCNSQLGCRYLLNTTCLNNPSHYACSETNYATQTICNSQYNCKWTSINETIWKYAVRTPRYYDVSAIPINSYVINASQTNTLLSYSGIGILYNQTMRICSLGENWTYDEGAMLPYVTWNNRSRTELWGMYGGLCSPASVIADSNPKYIQDGDTNIDFTQSLDSSTINCWVNIAGCNNGTLTYSNETVNYSSTSISGIIEVRRPDWNNFYPPNASYVTISYTQPPYMIIGNNYSGATWRANTTNASVMFNATLYDDDGFNASASYIFSYNGSGANCDIWLNNSAVTLGGFINGSNVSVIKQVGRNCEGKTIGYRFYVTDMYGASNVSDTKTLFKTSCGYVDTNLTMNYNYSVPQVINIVCLNVNGSNITVNCNGQYIKSTTPLGVGIFSHNNTGVTVKHCNIINTSDDGIELYGNTYSTYYNNTYFSNGNGQGIFIHETENNNISYFRGATSGVNPLFASGIGFFECDSDSNYDHILNATPNANLINSVTTINSSRAAIYCTYSNFSDSVFRSDNENGYVGFYDSSDYTNITYYSNTATALYCQQNCLSTVYNSTIKSNNIAVDARTTSGAIINSSINGGILDVNKTGSGTLSIINTTVNYEKISIKNNTPLSSGKVIIAWYEKTFVTNGTPISNANVNVTDNATNPVFDGITDILGYTNTIQIDQLLMELELNTSYTAHNFAANATHNTAGYNQSAINSSKTIQISLNYFRFNSTTRLFLNNTELNYVYFVNSTTNNTIFVLANTTSDCIIDLFENATLVNSSATSVTYYRTATSEMNNTIFNYTAICNETALYNASSASHNATVIDNSTYRTPSTTTVFLNGTNADVTYYVNSTTNNTIFVLANTTSDCIIDLFENATLVNSSATSVTYYRTATSEMNNTIFNYTAICNETALYNASSASHNATVIDNSSMELAAIPCPSVIPIIKMYSKNNDLCVAGFCIVKKIPTKTIYFPLLIGNLTFLEKQANVYLRDYNRKITQSLSFANAIFPSQNVTINVDGSCKFKNKLIAYLEKNKNAFW